MRRNAGPQREALAKPAGSAAAKLSKLRAQRQNQSQAGKVQVAVNSQNAVQPELRQRAAGEREEDSLPAALAEKDEIIHSLRSRLAIAQQQAQRFGAAAAPAAAAAEGQLAGGPSPLEAHCAQLEGANQQLRQRLQESLAELQAAHEQLSILQQLQQQLEEDVPGAATLVDAAVAQERALQDSRNERVLQMLKSKDEVIKSFEARYAEAQAEAVSYKKQLEAALPELDSSQVRVCELVEARAKLREELEGQSAAAAQAQSAAKAEISQLQGELGAMRQRDAERCLLHDRIMAQQEDLAAVHGEVQKLSEAVEAANVVIQELQAVVQEREEQLGQSDEQVQQLQKHMSRLLGVSPAEVPSLTAAAIPGQPVQLTHRIAELEAANERLEQALVHANGRGGASPGSPTGQSRDDDQDEVTQLVIRLAEREGQLQTAQQQVQELEAIQELARETALQTENKLRESLRQTAAYQQQCEALQQRLELSEGVACQLNARVSELALAEQAGREVLQEVQEALERARENNSEAERAKEAEVQALRVVHAEEAKQLQAALSTAEVQLAASQAEAASLQEQLNTLQCQLEMQPQPQLLDSGRGSSLGRSSFLSSVLEAAADAARGAAAPPDSSGLAVSWQEAAALPHDKLLALVHALQLDMQALQAQLDGARRDASAAHQRALAAERRARAEGQRQHSPLLASIAAGLAEMRQTSQAGAARDGDVKAAQLRQQHAEEMLRAAEAHVGKLKSELASRCQALQRQLELAEEQARQAEAERGAAQEARHAAERAAEERAAQLAVVMETLEVLQSGPADAQREHVLSMTAELASARLKEAALQQRCKALEDHLGNARAQVVNIQQLLASAAESSKAAHMAQAEEAAAMKTARAEADGLRNQLLEQREQAAKARAELSEARQAAATSKAAVAGLQAALRQAQERHLGQLSRERADATAALRSAQLSRLQSTLMRPESRAEASLQEVVSQLKAACAEAGRAGSAAGMVDTLSSHLQQLLPRVEHAESEAQLFAAELQAAREQCRSVEAAMEARTSEWQAAVAEREVLQHQLAQAEAAIAIGAEQQLRLEQDRNLALSEQLSHCKVQLAQMDTALQQVEFERAKCKAEASELLAKLTMAEVSMPPLAAPVGNDSSSSALSVSPEEQPLLKMLHAAAQRADGLAEQNSKLKAALQELQGRLGSLTTSIAMPAASSSQHVQELERHVKQQAQQLAVLERQLQQREVQALAHGAQAQQLQLATALLEARLREAQQAAAAAEQRAREELAGSNLQECEAVARQAALVREQAEQTVVQAQQKALYDVRQAQCRVEELEAQLLAEQQEKDTLHSTLAQMEAQLAEACATLDAKTAALFLVSQGRPAGGPASSPGKQPGSSVAALSQHLLEASLQHVEAYKQLQFADKLNKSLKKQLHVAERRAAQLKDALQAKVAAHKALAEQVQLLAQQRVGPSAQSSFAGLPDLFSEASRSETATAAAPGSDTHSGGAPAAGSPTIDGLPLPSIDVVGLQLEVARREAEVERLQAALGKALDAQRGQAECFASLTAQAQQKEQEFRSRLATLEEAASELGQLRARCYAVVHELRKGLLDAPSDGHEAAAGCYDPLGPEHLSELAHELLSQLQEQRQVIEKLQQYASTAASQATGPERDRTGAEALAPLECSQRAVIRSLTVQLADLRRQLVQLSTERDQLQERLRMLRGSLGSGHAAEAREAIDLQQEAADFGPTLVMDGLGPPGFLAPRPPARPGQEPLDHAAGMFALLQHHIRALTRAHEQLTALLQQQQGQSLGPATGEHDTSSVLLAQVAHAAAMLAAELPAMQATIQVLSAEVTWMLQGQQQKGGTGVRADSLAAAAPAPGPQLCLPAPANSAQAEAAAGQSDSAANAEERLVRARQRKDRWKKRYTELEGQFQAARSAAEQTEALLRERVSALEQAHQQLAAQHAAAAARVQSLQEAATQAEAEKAELRQSLEGCRRELAEAAALADTLRAEAQAQEREHCTAWQQLSQQAENAQGVLNQEREEHAQLVASLRAMIGSLQSSGDTESQLHSQLVSLAEKVAVLTAAQEAARLEVEQKESALVALQLELHDAHTAHAALAAEKQHADTALAGTRHEYEALQRLLASAESRLEQVEGTLAARCRALETKLADSCHLPEPPGVASLMAGLGGLQDAAADLQDRFERVEAQAAVLIQQKHAAAVAQWARLARSQRYRSAVRQLRDGLQHDLLEAQAQCQTQAAQLAQLQQLAAASQQECRELLGRLEEVQALHDSELQCLSERHAQDVAAMEQDMAAARMELQRQADLMAKAAAAAAEQRAKANMAARVSQVEERALQDITNAESQCSQLQSELSAARTEFKRYQAVKAVEVKLLEQRVMHLMRTAGSGASSASPPGRIKAAQLAPQGAASAAAAAGGALLPEAASGLPLADPAGAITAVSEIQAVCSSDGIAAALREANLERMQREQVEREAASAREAAELLRGRVKAAEGELAAVRARLGTEAKSAKERAEALQDELSECQQALHVAKAESSRRLKELTALQRQVADEGSRAGVPEAALEQERAAREAAEAQLREARQALARKAAMVKELRSKVSELEQELVMNSAAPVQAELDACTARLKQLHASCGSKDATIKELRQRLEGHVKLAAEQGMQEERLRSREVVQGLRADLAKREAQVASLRQELQQVHEDLAAATASMQCAVQERQAALEGSVVRLARAVQQGQQLAAVVQELLAMVDMLGGAVASGAAVVQQGQQGSMAGLALQLSSLVNLPAEDIEVLLGGPGDPRGSAGGGFGGQPALQGPGSLLPGLVQEAGHLVDQLRAGLDAGAPDDGSLLPSLLNLLAAVKQQCLRASDALDCATARLQHCAPAASSMEGPGSGGPSPAHAISYLEEQLRKAAAEVAEIEGRLM